ncbi:MAG: class I SAM-dependent methyltransferase [Cyanophyceae cyanobacterium]
MGRFNYYDNIAEIYDESRWIDDAIASDVSNFILKLVQAKPDTNFLEPGIGTGLNIFPFVQQGYTVTGIDISAEMLGQLRRKAGDQASNLTLIQGDASPLPFPNCSFDVVLTVHMSHGVSDLKTFGAEIHRVLKPGGFYLCPQWLIPTARLKFENQFRAIAANYTQKIEASRQSKRIDCDIELSQYLLERGYQEHYFNVKEWEVKNSVGELLKNFQSRAYGFCWRVEDAVFGQVMDKFHTFCVENYGSLATELSSQAKYELWSYQKPPHGN